MKKFFWYVYGLVLIIHIYLIFFVGLNDLASNLPIYSLLGLFAYSFEKSYSQERRKIKIESF